MKRSSSTPPSSRHSTLYCAPPTGACCATSLESRCCRNSAACGPLVSISPMCETSKTPASPRTARCSGADALVLDRHLPAGERHEPRAGLAMAVVERSALERGVGAGHEAARLAAASGPPRAAAACLGLCELVCTVRSRSSVPASLPRARRLRIDSGGSAPTHADDAGEAARRSGCAACVTASPGWAQRRLQGLDAALDSAGRLRAVPGQRDGGRRPAPKGVTVEQARRSSQAVRSRARA